MNNKEDIFKLSYGFRINGTYYNRLIGTTNGIKKEHSYLCCRKELTAYKIM